jgi:DNA-binding LacI/PurR family transcriptional regulator
MSATVAEIGRLAGVSTATVSRAMNNSGSVSPKAREAVLKVLREIRYVPKRSSSDRKNSAKPSKTANGLVEIIFHRHSPVEAWAVRGGDLAVGPLDPLPPTGLENETYRLGMSFYRRVIEGSVAELSHWGCRSVLQLTNDLTDPKFLAEMNKPDRQGALLVGEYSDNLQKFVEQCRHPLVLVDLVCTSSRDIVTIDNLGGIGQAFDHLHGLGHRRIGFIGVREEVAAYRERYLAFRLKLVEAQLPLNPQHVFSGLDHIQQVADGVLPILSGSDRPTALICSSDCYALGVIRAAASLGIAIPQQLSVVGFDDTEVAAMVTPALTTVHVPQALMGQQAARQLMASIQFPESDPHQQGCETRVRTGLVVRHSTAQWKSDGTTPAQSSPSNPRPATKVR